ncbi:MAG: MoaD/ThiS family protein [Candidatus Bathyarchaeia archaeon]
MAVTVKFFGSLRTLSGKSRIILRFENPVPLRELLQRIVEELPTLARALIDQELGDPRPNSLIIINGKEISALNSLETKVKDGDEVVFVPVLHGG